MAVFFTSDTHFGHQAIIRHCNRPFASAAAMDEGMISRWNSRIAPGDTVYHLGDFCFRGGQPAPYYRGRLNGEIHLIAGNHDGDTLKRHADCFASVSIVKEITIARQSIVMFHYPMREWDGAYRGAWHLFGHVHGGLDKEPLGYSMDVGVDSNRFYPWSLDEVAAALARRERHFGSDR